MIYKEPRTRSPEILENIEAEERRLWEEEQERMRRQREEERVKALFRQKEIERQAELERKKLEDERRRNEEEKQRRQAEEKRKEEERQREEQRRIEEELERKREEEMERKREKERQKRRAEEERKKTLVIDMSQQKRESAVLAGRAGPVSAMKPALLGAADTAPKAPVASSDNRKVKELVIRKEEDIPLDIEVEGGMDSPLGGKIVVAEVYHDGLAHRNGGIKRGDQILKVNGKSLENVTLSKAQELLWNAEQASGDTIKFLVVESDFKEDEITYF